MNSAVRAVVPFPPMNAARIEGLAVALDTADRDQFSEWCAFFGPRVAVLKVGLEAYLRFGQGLCEQVQETGADLFLDLKLHDIPNTVAGAVRAIRDLGAQYLTVHASGGAPMVRAAAEAAEGRIQIVAVTVLTSLDEEVLQALDLPGTPSDRAVLWAQAAVAAGATGLVCSPLEVASVRKAVGEEVTLITPGIRLAASGDDQRRVATPERARAWGADLLVVGRPLTRSKDPQAALEAFRA